MPKRSVHVLAVGWVVLTTLLLLAPSSNLPNLPGWLSSAVTAWIDLAVHSLLFLVLGLLVERSLAVLWPLGRSRAWTLLGGLLYACATELAQLLIPGRTASWGDLAADALGLSISILLLRRGAEAEPPFGLSPGTGRLS